MDWIAGPAVLGAMVISVALGAWSLGRWQAASALARVPRAGLAERATAPTFASGSSQHEPREGGIPAAVQTDQLNELHAEISAYRRTERVLTAFEGDVLCQHGASRPRSRDWQEFGVMGQPFCGKGGTDDSTVCGCLTCTGAAAPAAREYDSASGVLCAVQPSAAGEATRV